MSVLALTKNNAPTIFSVREALPFNDMIFKYDITSKGGKSTIMHITRSAITIGATALFVLAGLVEKAVRFSLDKIKQGIDKVLTADQQDAIKAKAAEKASAAAEIGKGFFQRHFGALFS